MNEVNRETEFDSSASTLYRISTLITCLHRVNIEGFKFSDNPIKDYEVILNRLFVECQAKLTAEESKVEKQIRDSISTIKNKWIADINRPKKLSGPIGRDIIPNPKYTQAWHEVKTKLNEYEIFLMRSMDRHNMLLKDKDRVEDSLI